LAKEYGVSENTIQRDAQFTEVVDAIAANCGEEVKELFLTSGGGLTKADALHLAVYGPDDQRRFIEDFRAGNKGRPWRPDGEDLLRVPRDLDGLVQALLREYGLQRLGEIHEKIALVLEKRLSG
jgi:hypothetical protein